MYFMFVINGNRQKLQIERVGELNCSFEYFVNITITIGCNVKFTCFRFARPQGRYFDRSSEIGRDNITLVGITYKNVKKCDNFILTICLLPPLFQF